MSRGFLRFDKIFFLRYNRRMNVAAKQLREWIEKRHAELENEIIHTPYIKRITIAGLEGQRKGLTDVYNIIDKLLIDTGSNG
jgi:hypothetical protein